MKSFVTVVLKKFSKNMPQETHLRDTASHVLLLQFEILIVTPPPLQQMTMWLQKLSGHISQYEESRGQVSWLPVTTTSEVNWYEDIPS